MKLANPLPYPFAVLIGGITLIIGVRLVRLPSTIMIPVAAAIATGAAIPFKQKESDRPKLDNPSLSKELERVRERANLLAKKAEVLRHEAKQLLTASSQLELYSAIEYACDRASELPSQIDSLARRLSGSDSLLSVSELQQQLTEVRDKIRSSSGVARRQLQQLSLSLENNLRLALQGADARQAQVVSLATLVIESAGILQNLQNRLRSSNLDNSNEINELKNLSEELTSMQESVNVLV
ncbi:hypothetical protein [Myxosarcina sp. GI1(2024)]